MDIQAPIEAVKGVGDKLGEKFRALGVQTVADLLEYYPRKYSDYSQVVTINQLHPGVQTIQAEIKQVAGRYVRGGLHITEAVASDSTGSVKLVWFNQPYRATSIKIHEQYFIAGNFELKRGRLSFMSPTLELVSELPIHTARIVPIYRESKGIKSQQIRKAIRQVLDNTPLLPSTIPNAISKEHKLLERKHSLELKHFPASLDDIAQADRRLAFEELFFLILASLSNKKEITQAKSKRIQFKAQEAKEFVAHLPFKLTDAQKKAVWQTYQDMDSTKPMNRLLEGDVGSGKTVVAAMAALMPIAEGLQVAFMAPTELLAQQHAKGLYELLKPLGLESTVTLLSGSMKPAEKARAYEAIQAGQALFVIGTHALIQEKVNWNNLALVIVDEQHRFGVKQRKALLAKAGHAPHMLSMTATPIPRSLALTVFGELEVSLLNEKPQNRLPIETQLIHPNDRQKIYEQVTEKLSRGEQVYVVCPLIAESSSLQLASAEATFEQINKAFKNYSVGLLHGKLKADAKDAIMRQFSDGKLDILVATTVIEVGVDVPNATTMLIEGPERFGLAQLHQLRGRVGRSHQQGHCFLMMSDTTDPSPRLRAIASTQDGFKLAELDLQLRGAGALYGNLQHGALDLRIADFTDVKLIREVRAAATKFIDSPANLIQYPYIRKRIEQLQTVVHLN
jgi:ATP-dependent DNA helicase RecG